MEVSIQTAGSSLYPRNCRCLLPQPFLRRVRQRSTVRAGVVVYNKPCSDTILRQKRLKTTGGGNERRTSEDTGNGEGSSIVVRGKKAFLGLLCGSLVSLSAGGDAAFALDGSPTPFSADNPIFDEAKIIPIERRKVLNEDLKDFERRTGYRLRLLTGFRGESTVTNDDIIDTWKPDRSTVVIAVDPSSPNIVAFRYIGLGVDEKLKRAFWIELQSRYGNMFFIRDEGELAAIEGVLGAVRQCVVKPEGCVVVPGLPMNQYYFTLGLSIAGGLVFGFASRLEPGGFISQRWVWVMVFSPLWVILYVNLGLGPVLSRTSESWPVLGNTAGFLAAILAFQLLDFPPKWMTDVREDQSD